MLDLVASTVINAVVFLPPVRIDTLELQEKDLFLSKSQHIVSFH